MAEMENNVKMSRRDNISVDENSKEDELDEIMRLMKKIILILDLM